VRPLKKYSPERNRGERFNPLSYLIFNYAGS
jgi:hypothetical protein